jgi:hypothetical protein
VILGLDMAFCPGKGKKNFSGGDHRFWMAFLGL